jgi:hypothetical protein
VRQSGEEHAAVDDLRTRLAEAADQTAQLARAPGPAATLRRAGARRRRRAGEALLAVAMVAAVVVAGRGVLLAPPGVPATEASQALAWRPLVAREWKGTVAHERPLDPVLVAAQGVQAGDPWRLVVYRSTYRPGLPGQDTDVCYILEWFVTDLGSPPPWQLYGTCAPEAQAATVLAVNGPGGDRGLAAVIGRAPDDADRVRLELRGRAPVETTVRPEGASLGRFYVAFVPRASYLARMAALDGGGNQVGAAAGQGDLTRQLVGGEPPTGPVQIVATVPTGSHGIVEVLAWPVRDGFCLSEETAAGAGSSSCQGTPQALAPRLTCSSSSAGELRLLYGGVPRASTTVTVRAASRRVDVPAHDAGAPFDRAFFATVVSNEPPREPLLVTARDGQGTEVWSKRLPWTCA